MKVSESHTLGQTPLPDSCLLDALETSPHSTDQTPACGTMETSLSVDVAFRHSGWMENRHRVQRAMQTLDTPESRRARFDSCGSRAWVLQSIDDPGVFKIACDRCRDRFCVPCARERSRHIASRVGDFAEGREIRFITLTLRHTERTLRQDVDRLYTAFVKLRRRRLWRKSQKGGIGFLEIKRNDKGDGWHVHLHAIVEGHNIEQKHLSAAWHEVTGDSFITKVQWCHSPKEAAFYAAKYSGKGIHGDCYRDPEVLRASIVAIKGRRLVAKFGTWADLDLKAVTDEGDWRAVDSLRRLVARSRSGDQAASSILQHLSGDETCTTEARSPPAHGECHSSSISNRDVRDVQNSFSLA